MDRSTAADAVRPLEMVARVCLLLLGTLALAVPVLAAIWPGHFYFAAWGSEEPCVRTPQSGLQIYGDGTGNGAGPHVREGVRIGTPDAFELCQEHMAQVTRALVSVPTLLDILWTLGLFALLLGLTSAARRHGLFTNPVARLASRLGWYLLIGCLMVSVVHAVGYACAIGRLVGDYPLPLGILGNLQWNWGAIIGGVAAISVGRVMRQAVPLREEIETTV